MYAFDVQKHKLIVNLHGTGFWLNVIKNNVKKRLYTLKGQYKNYLEPVASNIQQNKILRAVDVK